MNLGFLEEEDAMPEDDTEATDKSFISRFKVNIRKGRGGGDSKKPPYIVAWYAHFPLNVLLKVITRQQSNLIELSSLLNVILSRSCNYILLHLWQSPR